MDLIKIICFMRSGLFAFIAFMVLIMLCLPDCLLEFFGFITALGIIGFVVFYIISLFR